MPEQSEWLEKRLTSFEELVKFCRMMVLLGIEHIRLTDGEPLIHQGIVHFIRDLHWWLDLVIYNLIDDKRQIKKRFILFTYA